MKGANACWLLMRSRCVVSRSVRWWAGTWKQTEDDRWPFPDCTFNVRLSSSSSSGFLLQSCAELPLWFLPNTISTWNVNTLKPQISPLEPVETKGAGRRQIFPRWPEDFTCLPAGVLFQGGQLFANIHWRSGTLVCSLSIFFLTFTLPQGKCQKYTATKIL